MPIWDDVLRRVNLGAVGRVVSETDTQAQARDAIGALGAGDVDDAVAAAVAAEPGVIAAAELAAAAAIEGLEVVEVTDPALRLPEELDQVGDFDRVETDANGRRSRADLIDGSTSMVLRDDTRITGTVTATLISGPHILCIGDSLTGGYAGSPTPATTSYPEELQKLLPLITVRNWGIGSETSPTIAARVGAIPLLVTPTGGEIPASGPVELTVHEVDGSTPLPLRLGAWQYWEDVTIAGVRGLIHPVTGGGSTWPTPPFPYEFTRHDDGDAVAVLEPQAVVMPEAVTRRNDIPIIWMGQNPSFYDEGGDPDWEQSDARARSDTAAIIQELTAGVKRFLVMNRPTADDADDAKWFAVYGRRFLSPRATLAAPILDEDDEIVSSWGLTEAGLTPTSQDLIDIANGIIPISLRSDAIHLNNAGNRAIAAFVYRRLVELKYVEELPA